MNQNLNFLENYQCQGMLLPIITYPAPILRKIAPPVMVFDEALRILCQNMLYTMYQAPGIGLAAPQIGKSLQLFVLDTEYTRERFPPVSDKDTINGTQEEDEKSDEENFYYILGNFKPQIFINPKIQCIEGEICYQEGCLSVPGIYEEVNRCKKIKVEYQDLWGNPQELIADELLSICIQHEYDHLQGIVFLERLSELKKSIYLKKLQKKARKGKEKN